MDALFALTEYFPKVFPNEKLTSVTCCSQFDCVGEVKYRIVFSVEFPV